MTLHYTLTSGKHTGTVASMTKTIANYTNEPINVSREKFEPFDVGVHAELTVNELPLLPETLDMIPIVIPTDWISVSKIRYEMLGKFSANDALVGLRLGASRRNAIIDVRYALEQETGHDYQSDEAIQLFERYLLESPKVETRRFLTDGLIVRAREVVPAFAATFISFHRR